MEIKPKDGSFVMNVHFSVWVCEGSGMTMLHALKEALTLWIGLDLGVQQGQRLEMGEVQESEK